MKKKLLTLAALTACLSGSLLLAGCAGSSAGAKAESAPKQEEEELQTGTESAENAATAEVAETAQTENAENAKPAGAPTVYFTSDITAEGLVKIYDTLGWTPTGRVAVKISTGGTRLDRVIVGSHAENYSDWVILSHFKGHAMAGFGGAIKNVGIGISSPTGKVYVHTAGTQTSGSIWYNDQDAWLEALAEMVSGFSSHVGKEHIIYINVMNRLSVDCDCDGNPAEPDIHDIGILASTDPVALDQACVDLVYQAEGNEALVNRMESLHGIHTLEHAEEIGLGSRTYELVNIDKQNDDYIPKFGKIM